MTPTRRDAMVALLTPAQTRAALATLRALTHGASALCGTHQVNVTAFTGLCPASREIVALRLGAGLAALARMSAMARGGD